MFALSVAVEQHQSSPASLQAEVASPGNAHQPTSRPTRDLFGERRGGENILEEGVEGRERQGGSGEGQGGGGVHGLA